MQEKTIGGSSADGANPNPTSRSCSVAHEPINWHELVERIQTDDPSGAEMLHATFARGLKYLLARKLGTDCEDGIHETLLVVLKAIRDGKIREPERLPGFVRTVAMRYAFGIIGQRVRSRESELPLETGVYTPVMAEQNPEQQAIIQERAELIRQTLEQMSRRDREILERFYLHEQTPEQICELMQLTETQFRLLKSRAKAKFGELGNKKVNKRRPTTVSIRNGYSVSISPSLS